MHISFNFEYKVASNLALALHDSKFPIVYTSFFPIEPYKIFFFTEIE